MNIKASKLLQSYTWGRNYKWFSMEIYEFLQAPPTEDAVATTDLSVPFTGDDVESTPLASAPTPHVEQSSPQYDPTPLERYTLKRACILLLLSMFVYKMMKNVMKYKINQPLFKLEDLPRIILYLKFLLPVP